MALAPARACFRFYAELNDHLPPSDRYRSLEKEFFVPASVKDMIESIGVPHTEVELVVVNGESSDFVRLVQNGESHCGVSDVRIDRHYPGVTCPAARATGAKVRAGCASGQIGGLSAHAGIRRRLRQSGQRLGTGADFFQTEPHPADTGPRCAEIGRAHV